MQVLMGDLNFVQFSFEVGIAAIFGHLDIGYREELKKNYRILDKGYNCFPTNIPGTPFKRALMVSHKQSHLKLLLSILNT